MIYNLQQIYSFFFYSQEKIKINAKKILFTKYLFSFFEFKIKSWFKKIASFYQQINLKYLML